MKKLILLCLTIVTMAAISYAANPASMTISCTITGTSLGVTISSASWALSATSVNTAYTSGQIKVSNSSGGLTESYKISASTTNWMLGASAGANTAVLLAALKTWPSASCGFTGTDTVLATAGLQTCDTTHYSDSDSNCGQTVSYATPDRAMFLKLTTPTSVTNTSETITLRITAY